MAPGGESEERLAVSSRASRPSTSRRSSASPLHASSSSACHCVGSRVQPGVQHGLGTSHSIDVHASPPPAPSSRKEARRQTIAWRGVSPKVSPCA